MNANELYKELSALFHSLKTGEIKPTVACEMTNAAGKMIRLAELQVKFIGINPGAKPSSGMMKFLESTTV